MIEIAFYLAAFGKQDTGGKIQERYSQSTCSVCKVCTSSRFPAIIFSFPTCPIALITNVNGYFWSSYRTATKVSEMLGNVNTSSALSAFEKMEEKGFDCHFSFPVFLIACGGALHVHWVIYVRFYFFLIIHGVISTICCHSSISVKCPFQALAHVLDILYCQ